MLSPGLIPDWDPTGSTSDEPFIVVHLTNLLAAARPAGPTILIGAWGGIAQAPACKFGIHWFGF